MSVGLERVYWLYLEPIGPIGGPGGTGNGRREPIEVQRQRVTPMEALETPIFPRISEFIFYYFIPFLLIALARQPEYRDFVASAVDNGPDSARKSRSQQATAVTTLRLPSNQPGNPCGLLGSFRRSLRSRDWLLDCSQNPDHYSAPPSLPSAR